MTWRRQRHWQHSLPRLSWSHLLTPLVTVLGWFVFWQVSTRCQRKSNSRMPWSRDSFHSPMILQRPVLSKFVLRQRLRVTLSKSVVTCCHVYNRIEIRFRIGIFTVQVQVYKEICLAVHTRKRKSSPDTHNVLLSRHSKVNVYISIC